MDFKKMLMSQIEEMDTEPQIIEFARKLRYNMGIFPDLTEEEYQNAVDIAVETLNITFGESYSVQSDEKNDPWFADYYKELGITRWDRYVDYLKNQKGFAPSVITSMNDNLFKITDLLGDPNGKNFMRKGLIVGDVQSGKTANYVGLMNLATDANYKLIIILTGTTNTLREQTQIRIEEGMGKAKITKGVAMIQNADYKTFKNAHPVYLTTREHDFAKSSRENFQTSIENTTVPIVIVTKKNSTALKNIFEWLSEYSLLQNHDHIDSSLLLIDDEADFASVNTKPNELESPTAINKRIRDILQLFTKSSYIGFTATPFANIFIDPQYSQDLFPRDYIYILGESKAYLGVQRVFGDNADCKGMLVELSESKVEHYLPLKHKKESQFNNLAPSMIDALNLFFLANVIRDLRGETSAHRSMLMNISRFTAMHEKIQNAVKEYVLEVQKEIRLYSKLPLEEAMIRPTIRSIKKSFDKHYFNLKEGYTFEKLLENMNNSIYRINVAVVNQDSKGKEDELNYLKNESDGERVIVIGGFALSRGLTLEGLMISYYYRNSVMYDSLLQMGRWFGYRSHYEDLCKIFMTTDVISDFKFIAMATQELKDSLEIKSKQGLTPKDFGIKVRSGQTGLIITARNKMRSGVQITAEVDFSRDVIETYSLSLSTKKADVNNKNRKVIEQFVENHKSNISELLDPNPKNKSKGLIDIDKAHIIQFLKDYEPAEYSRFDNELIIKWLRSNSSPNLDKWDIAFANGSDNDESFDYGNGIMGRISVRTMVKVKNSDKVYKNNNSRLASPNDGRLGLNERQWELVKSRKKADETISQKDYFDAEVQRKPIILIYSVLPRETKDGEYLIENYIPLLSVGIPELEIGKSHYVDYTVNKVYQDNNEVEVEMNDI